MNTSVDRAPSMARITSGSILRPMCPAHGKRSIVAGSALTISIVFASSPLTMRVRPGLARARDTPTRHVSAWSRLASVAESPQTDRPGLRVRRRASASSACTPRFDDMSSCHSSQTTAVTCAKRSRQSARESISVRLSGVVTSAVGSRVACFARADDDVSPVRTAIVQCGFSARAAFASASPVSLASARSGVSHSSVSGGGLRSRSTRPQRDGAERRGVRLAHAGRRVHEAALAGGVGRPHFALERERGVPLRGEPAIDGGERIGDGGRAYGKHGAIVRAGRDTLPLTPTLSPQAGRGSGWRAAGSGAGEGNAAANADAMKRPVRQAVMRTTFGFAAVSGDRNAASSTPSRALAVLRCASFTWP